MSYSISYSGPDSLTLTVESDADFSATEEQQHSSGEITASGEEWLNIVVTVLSMLPGKPTKDGTEYLLGPVGIDASMIGQLVAAKMEEQFPTIVS